MYMGTNPANDNFTFVDDNSLRLSSSKAVNQRDADLLHFWDKVCLETYFLSYSLPSSGYLKCMSEKIAEKIVKTILKL